MAKIVRTRTRVKRSLTGPPKGGPVYEPGSRRLTVRYEKKSCLLPTPRREVGTGPRRVRYEHPVGGAHMHMGDLKVSPCAPGPKVPVKKKKKNLGLRLILTYFDLKLK